MSELPEGVKLQKVIDGEKFYSIAPHLSGGVTEAETLEKVTNVAKKYNCMVKITSGQNMKLIGLKEDNVQEAWEDLDIEFRKKSKLGCRGVRFCVGNTLCKSGKKDSINLGKKLEDKYLGMKLPSIMKMAVSGCNFCCTAPGVKDIGVIGTETGFELRVGGSGGYKPRIAKRLAVNLTTEEVLLLVDKIISTYKRIGKAKERLGATIKRVSWNKFKAEVVDKEVEKTIAKEKLEVEKEV